MTTRPRIKTRLLEVFDAVMKAGNITAAGRHLGISQPAVSVSLRALEDHLGVTLFDRMGRQLVPTDMAWKLAESTAPVFAAIEALADDAHQVAQMGLSKLRIAASPSLGHGTALTALREVMRDHPTYEALVTVGDNAQVQQAVTCGQADLGLVLGRVDSGGLISQKMGKTHLVTLLPRDHAFVKRTTLGPLDLAPEVVIGAGSDIEALVMHAFSRQGVAYAPQIKAGFAQTACAMVQAGLGITVVDVFAAELYAGPHCAIRRFYPGTQIAAQALMAPHIAGDRLHLIEAYLEALRNAMEFAPSLTHQHRAATYN